jgi:sensor histidine kinase YesM
MKRLVLHAAFWLVYFVQDVLLIFLLNSTRMQLTTERNLILSSGHVLVLLIPKLLFTYFMLSVALNRIIREGFGKKWSLYSVIALLFTIILYRVLLVYTIDPLVYGWQDESASFLYPLGFPVALMDIGFVSGAAIAIKQVRQQLLREKNEELLKKEKLETELKYLRNQTNPHFLFNTLNNIYALARKKSNDTPDAIMKLSKLLRFMLYEAARPQIAIGDEIRLLDDYIDLEKIRYNSKLTVSFLKEVHNEEETISPLLLLPLVENAFKHVASESRFASFIHIEMKLQDGILKFSIKNTRENNGQAVNGTNIGLNNVKRQLQLLYTDYDFQVISEPAVFLVLLTINLKSYAKNKMSHS